MDIYRNKLVNMIETKPLCISLSNLADMLTMVNPIDLEVTVQRWKSRWVSLTNVGCMGMLHFALLYLFYLLHSFFQQIKAIAETGCTVLVAGGKVGELAQHYCNKYKLMVVRLMSKWDLRRLCRSIAATPLPRVVSVTPLYKSHTTL